MKTLGKIIQAVTAVGMLAGLAMAFMPSPTQGAGVALVLLCFLGYAFGRFVMMLGS